MGRGLAMTVAGAVQGYGDALVGKAEARREAALVRLREQYRHQYRQRERAQDRRWQLEDQRREQEREGARTERTVEAYGRLYGERGAGSEPRGLGGSSGARGPSATGKADPERVRHITGRLGELGYPKHVAAGLTGNLMQESSGLDPAAVGDGGNSFGVGQWNGPRKEAYLAFARERGADPADLDTQIAFMDHELKTSERGAFEAIMSAKTPEEAARIASKKYWRPGTPRNDKRVANAREVWAIIADPDTPESVRGDLRRGLGVGSQKPSATEEKIALLMEGGLDRTTAAHIAAGRYVVSRNPVNSQAEIIDKATGQVVGNMPEAATRRGGASEVAGAPPDTGQPGERLYDRADTATGVVSQLKEFSTDTLGQLPGEFGESFQFPETVEDRQAFRTAAGNMFRALSVNPKMPVAEINRIREQISIEPGVFKSPEGLRARMRSIDATLREHIGTQRELAKDPSMPASARQDAATNAAAMETFLAGMGVPQEGQGEGTASPIDWEAYPAEFRDLPVVNGDADYERLPPGAMFIAPDGSVRRKP